MFCKQCGAKLDEDAQFCKQCGTATKHNGDSEAINTQEQNASPAAINEGEQPQAKSIEKKPKKGLFIGFAAMLAVIVAAIALIGIFGWEKTPTMVENVYFGDKMKTVKSVEHNLLAEETDKRLIYTVDRIQGYDTELNYSFNDKHKLEEVWYKITLPTDITEDEMSELYEQLIRDITREYGEPDKKYEEPDDDDPDLEWWTLESGVVLWVSLHPEDSMILITNMKI